VSLEKLIKSNLRFVISVANQYPVHDGLTLSDLINEGNIGLIKEDQRFDETLGYKFISYAVFWIRRSILDVINKKSKFITIPINQLFILKKIKTGTCSLEQILGRQPRIEEISLYLQLSIKKIEDMIEISSKQTSLDGIGTKRCFTIYEISKKLNVTSDTIRRIRYRSLFRIKHSKKCVKLLESYSY